MFLADIGVRWKGQRCWIEGDTQKKQGFPDPIKQFLTKLLWGRLGEQKTNRMPHATSDTEK